MTPSNNYIAVKKEEKQAKEGEFEVVDVADEFLYRGVVTHVPEQPVFIGNTQLGPGVKVLFAKYSPDTHEVELDGERLKFVAVADLLAVL